MNRTILSLAIIKSHWEKEKTDYIDIFIPLVGNLIVEKKYQLVDIETFQNDFKKRYGLIIPINPIITIFNRATKKKLLNRKNGQFYVNHEKISEFDFSIEATELERKFQNVINAISKYAKITYKISPSNEEIENALLSFLKQHDLDILFASKEKTILPQIKSTSKLRYLISAYSIYAYETEPVTFKFLLDISIGHALSGAILYSDFNSFSGKLSNLNIYIDTPLILSLLGYSGEFKQNSIIELLKILDNEKVNLFILETTRSEVDAILQDCHKWLDKGSYDLSKASKILRFCHRNGISSSDIESKILTLDTIIEQYSIVSTSVPAYEENRDFQINESDLKKTILKTYKGIIPNYDTKDYNKNLTIDRDVKVLSGIYRFRKGYKPKTIKDSRDLFITSNTALAFASRRFETKENGHSFVIPTCLTDVFLGTVIWLQSPQLVESLNEKKFIADCYSAVLPSDTLIKRYMLEIQKMKDEQKINNDEYYLLRTHRTSINLLETKTMGDPEAFNGETTEEILDSIILTIKGVETQKFEKEKSEHKKTKEELSVEKTKNVLIENSLEVKAERIATFIGKIIFWGLTILIAIALVFNIFSNYFQLGEILKVIIWIFIGIITLFNISAGFNVIGMKDKLIVKLKNRISKWLKE